MFEFEAKMMVKLPRMLRRIYAGAMCKVQTKEKKLFLTFDDGPIPEVTPWVLDVLKQLEAQENIGNFVPGKFLDYINTGSTSNSVNFPNLTLPTLENAHRLIHIHANVPGILAKINQVLAEHGINIVVQYLKTNETIGYVITDINKGYDEQVIAKLRAIEHTIKFRVLY